ncbi:hypothetical protein PHJA_002948500 [Phtheirospermum japonicum]|uniref:Uncharacterized protein n=1 Tax=Phtheirospermum japonicum TaxID=374723 RepID=A0A830DIW9_9LAMI|nr:hypothetical protein PHJA_002948500 [Phtheirospermum japonicum]
MAAMAKKEATTLMCLVCFLQLGGMMLELLALKSSQFSAHSPVTCTARIQLKARTRCTNQLLKHQQQSYSPMAPQVAQTFYSSQPNGCLHEVREAGRRRTKAAQHLPNSSASKPPHFDTQPSPSVASRKMPQTAVDQKPLNDANHRRSGVHKSKPQTLLASDKFQQGHFTQGPRKSLTRGGSSRQVSGLVQFQLYELWLY